MCQGGSVHEVSDAQSRWKPSLVVGRPRVWLAGQGLVSYCLKSTVELTHSTYNSTYKNPHTPFGGGEIRKLGLASYSAPKFFIE
jgi:hypothetical protein